MQTVTKAPVFFDSTNNEDANTDDPTYKQLVDEVEALRGVLQELLWSHRRTRSRPCTCEPCARATKLITQRN